VVKIDLTGQRFGRLTVIGEASNKTKGGRPKWRCLCDCGKNTEVESSHLRSGDTQSCGCLSRDMTIARSIMHGKTHTRLFITWNSMRQRCRDKNCKNYPHYGGRGIKVCDEWDKDFTAFETWALSNGYADNLSIDRIDNEGNYEPSNCRWSDRLTQQNNTRKNHFISISEETHTIAEWARIKGLKPNTIHWRLRMGWKPEDAILGKKGVRV